MKYFQGCFRQPVGISVYVSKNFIHYLVDKNTEGQDNAYNAPKVRIQKKQKSYNAYYVLESITLRPPGIHVELTLCWTPGCFNTGKNMSSHELYESLNKVYFAIPIRIKNIRIFIAHTLPKCHLICNTDTFYKILFSCHTVMLMHLQQFLAPQCII